MTTNKVMSITVLYDRVMGWAAIDEMTGPDIAGFGTTAAGAIDDLLLQIDGPAQPMAPKPCCTCCKFHELFPGKPKPKAEEWVSRVTDAPTWADGTKPATEAHQHWFRKFSDG